MGESQGLPRRSGGTAAEKKMLPGVSQQQAAYPAVPDTFLSEKACLFLVVKEIPGCYNKEEKSELRTGSGKMKEVF